MVFVKRIQGGLRFWENISKGVYVLNPKVFENFEYAFKDKIERFDQMFSK